MKMREESLKKSQFPPSYEEKKEEESKIDQ